MTLVWDCSMHVAARCSVLQRVAVCCSASQCVAVACVRIDVQYRRVESWYSVCERLTQLQRNCNTLQRAATHSPTHESWYSICKWLVYGTLVCILQRVAVRGSHFCVTLACVLTLAWDAHVRKWLVCGTLACVLQRVAVCCCRLCETPACVLQHVAVCCSHVCETLECVLQCFAVCCCRLCETLVCVLQCVAVCCNVLQLLLWDSSMCVAARCSMLQSLVRDPSMCVAARCTALLSRVWELIFSIDHSHVRVDLRGNINSYTRGFEVVYLCFLFGSAPPSLSTTALLFVLHSKATIVRDYLEWLLFDLYHIYSIFVVTLQSHDISSLHTTESWSLDCHLNDI